MRESLIRNASPANDAHRLVLSAALAGRGEEANLARWDAFELESLAINIDAAMLVNERHQFFGWTQGTLQSIIEHELLICVLQNQEFGTLVVDNFCALPQDTTTVSEMFRQDLELAPYLIRTWEANRCRAVVCDISEPQSKPQSKPQSQPQSRTQSTTHHETHGAWLAANASFSSGALATQLRSFGATELIVHGTPNTAGKLASLFVFCCKGLAAGRRKTYLAELLVPFLHSAWIRTQVNWYEGSQETKAEAAGLLTAREREILGWVYQGKSNIEIGIILNISPLTVKNHVQKILRRLNVTNRTQAVGKALALRILKL